MLLFKRYEREAYIWSSLAHANVLPFYGLLEVSHEIYLVSPWMEHGDLAAFISSYLRFLASAPHEQLSNRRQYLYRDLDEYKIVRLEAPDRF